MQPPFASRSHAGSKQAGTRNGEQQFLCKGLNQFGKNSSNTMDYACIFNSTLKTFELVYCRVSRLESLYDKDQSKTKRGSRAAVFIDD